MKYRTKKAFLITTLLVALSSGTIFYNARATQTAPSLALAAQTPTTTHSRFAASPTTGSTSGAGTPGAGSTPSGVTETQASYALTSGSFTGQREYAYYGYVQVQAVVQNGKLQQVKVLEHPNDNGTSRYINSVAMPYLVQEAVQTQTANVSLISGATLSSEAFVKSLSTALTQAQA